jgi:hypothetical protein
LGHVVGDLFGPRLFNGSYGELCDDEYIAKDRRPRIFRISASMTGQLHTQRQLNLRAMRSPPSIALGVFSIIAVLLASIFYDHPIMKAPPVFASLRQHIAAQ